MGIYFAASMEHQLAFRELMRLPALLNANPQLMAGFQTIQSGKWELFRRRNSHRTLWKWDCDFEQMTETSISDGWNRGEAIPMSGPISTLYVERFICEFYCWDAEWNHFLINPLISRALRSICLEIVKMLHNVNLQAVYFPNHAGSIIDKPKSLRQIIDAFEIETGHPAIPTWMLYEKQIKSFRWAEDKFLIDDFYDLLTSPTKAP